LAAIWADLTPDGRAAQLGITEIPVILCDKWIPAQAAFEFGQNRRFVHAGRKEGQPAP